MDNLLNVYFYFFHSCPTLLTHISMSYLFFQSLAAVSTRGKFSLMLHFGENVFQDELYDLDENIAHS